MSIDLFFILQQHCPSLLIKWSQLFANNLINVHLWTVSSFTSYGYYIYFTISLCHHVIIPKCVLSVSTVPQSLIGGVTSALTKLRPTILQTATNNCIMFTVHVISLTNKVSFWWFQWCCIYIIYWTQSQSKLTYIIT